MAPGVPGAAVLLVIGAVWRQVSGEAVFLSKGAGKLVSSGSSALLSEEGYHQVANLKSDEQMHQFVSRLLHNEGLEAHTADLSGFVPWYSGTRAVQSLQRLREELFAKPWVHRIFGADPTPVATKPAVAAPAAKPDGKLKAIPSAWALQSKNVANLADWVVTEAAAAAPAAKADGKLKTIPSPSALSSPAANWGGFTDWVVTEVKTKTKTDATPALHKAKPALHKVNNALHKAKPNAKRQAKKGVAAHPAHSAAKPATAAPLAMPAGKRKAIPSALVLQSKNVADLADWVVTEAAAAAPAAKADGKLKTVPSPSALSSPAANWGGFADWVVTEVKTKAKPDGAAHPTHSAATPAADAPHTPRVSQAAQVLANANQSQPAHTEHQSQLASTKPHGRALSWIAQQSQQSASKVARDMGNKLSKPILVMKDLGKLQAEDRARFLESIENTNVVLQALDGSLKVLKGSAVNKLFTLTKEVNQKEPEELRAIIHSKGAKCNNCTSHELVERVIATWDWPVATKSTSKASKVQKRAAISEDATRTCKSKCYKGEHAELSWTGHKCKWKNCGGCPECNDEAHSHVLVVREKKDASVRACNAKCYTGKHADQPWGSKKCRFQNCKGCPECETTASPFNICKTQCYMGKRANQPWKEKKCKSKNCNGCPECASEPASVSDDQPPNRQRPEKSRRVEKSHSHASDLTIDAASENASTVVADVAKSTADEKRHPHISELGVDTAVKDAGTAVGDVAKSTALGVQEVMQGASEVASSMFSKFLGFFGHEDKTTSQIEHEMKKSAPQAEQVNQAKTAKADANNVQKATKKTQNVGSSHAEIQKPSELADPEEPTHASKVEKATKSTADKITNFIAKPVQHSQAEKVKPPRKTEVKVTPKAAEAAKPQKSAGSTQALEHAKTIPQVNLKAKKIDQTLEAAASAKVSDASDGKASLETAVSPISKHRLPAVPSLLENSTQVIEVLNKQISTLKEHLAEAESESEAVVANRKAEYEGKLEQQHTNITAIRQANKQLRHEIDTLFKVNSDLRTRATKLKDRGSQLRKQISDLHTSITVAQEYLNATVENTSKDGEHVHVLSELDEQDALRARSEEHDSALRQVGSVALLQLSSKTEPSDPLEVVRILKGRFDDLDREEAASLETLKMQFEEKLSEEAQRQDALEKEGDELRKSKEGQLALREKLQTAVDYLTNTNSFLEQQIKGLQAYALRVAR